MFISSDGDQQMYSYIGVIVAIVGNITISIALNIQKAVHNELALASLPPSRPDSPLSASNSCRRSAARQSSSHLHAPGSPISVCATFPNRDDVTTPLLASSGDDSYTAQPYWKNKYWWFGQLLMSVGELGNFMAYGFAPTVLVSPLGTVALISNAIIAPIFLHEESRRRDGVGIFFAFVGTVIIVIVSSQTTEPVLTPDDIASALRQFQFMVYMAVTLSLSFLMAHLSNLQTFGGRYIMVDLSMVAIYGGYTVMATKALSSLLNLGLIAIIQFSITYWILLILVVTCVVQITYLNKSLARFESVQVLPTNFVMFTTSSIIGSSVLFNDLAHTSLYSLLGVAFMFLGVWLITGERRHSGDIDSPTESISSSILTDEEVARESQVSGPLSSPSAFSKPLPRSHALSNTVRSHHSDDSTEEEVLFDSPAAGPARAFPKKIQIPPPSPATATSYRRASLTERDLESAPVLNEARHSLKNFADAVCLLSGAISPTAATLQSGPHRYSLQHKRSEASLRNSVGSSHVHPSHDHGHGHE
ncbi:magnesium transporter NIPA-domain-containing protein [Polychytrium aggregatum]|uniref:magnesium transporter NIPA-domain-containing protein n=1 Tax=Polychytrium aggregatum TaxID=110093 RepID=UPI0022FF3358|nr:magnesium transporter NIPA-domain-containing protein [Polychytrium aggregatum]KAI9193090.1 magnesium transporter NIPA-domain-containing protein [Polychytrium aggregatum]